MTKTFTVFVFAKLDLAVICRAGDKSSDLVRCKLNIGWPSAHWDSIIKVSFCLDNKRSLPGNGSVGKLLFLTLGDGWHQLSLLIIIIT